jgi:hypothetical protein
MPAERRDVLDTLQRHGVSRAVAAELWRLARRLRSDTARRKREYAVTLDVASGQPVGRVLTGTATNTDMTPHLRAFRPEHRYVLLHTHPMNTSFSQYDVLILGDHASIQTMVAVGVDDTWYMVSRVPETGSLNPRSMFDECVNERRRLALQQVTPTEISHLAMESVASRHGLRYDRVTGSRDDRPHS